MKRRASKTAFAATVFLALSCLGRADSITLNTGKMVEGEIVEETAEQVRVAVGGMVLTIPRNKIASMQKGGEAAPADSSALERLEPLELKGEWADLYEAATALLRRDPKNKRALEKQQLADKKIRESLGGEKVAELVRQRRFDEAIDFLSGQIRDSNLAGRPAGAVGRRALAEIHVARAESRMRTSLDGHAPLADARAARKLDPTTPRLDLVEGLALMKLHMFADATPFLERAAAADPKNVGILLELVRCYHQTQEYAKIARLFEAAPETADASAQRWPEFRKILAEAYAGLALKQADAGSTAAAATYERYLSFTDRTRDQLRDAVGFFERVGDAKRARAVRDELFYGRRPESPVTLPDPSR